VRQPHEAILHEFALSWTARCNRDQIDGGGGIDTANQSRTQLRKCVFRVDRDTLCQKPETRPCTLSFLDPRPGLVTGFLQDILASSHSSHNAVATVTKTPPSPPITTNSHEPPSVASKVRNVHPALRFLPLSIEVDERQFPGRNGFRDNEMSCWSSIRYNQNENADGSLFQGTLGVSYEDNPIGGCTGTI
jgi:hypothetical protein